MSPATRSPLLDRYTRMPRSLRWGIVAIAGIALFLLADSTVWALARTWSDRASAIQGALDDARTKKASLDNDLRSAVIAHGAIKLPDDEAEGSSALAEAVNAVMNEYPGVVNFSYDSRGSARLPATALRGLIGAGQRASKVIGELQFDAPPEQATAIIAALESHPDVEAINRITIRRHEGVRRVNVRATVEAWVVSAGNERRRGA